MLDISSSPPLFTPNESTNSTNRNSTSLLYSLPNCSIPNCLSCSDRYNCDKCKDTFSLLNKKCYSTQCSIFGQCKYCNELDCILCESGYKVSYGYCKETQNLIKLEVLFGVILPLIIVITLILLILVIRRRRQRIEVTKVISPDLIGKKRPKPGQYIIMNTTNINNSGIINISSSEVYDKTSDSSLSNDRRSSINKISGNKCVVCNERNIFSFAQCGCGLCIEHSAKEKGVICPLHGTELVESFVIKKGQKKIQKVKISERKMEENVKMCPVCKIEQGTMSFNCGCPVLLCVKCFNDNVYMFKLNMCPGCNKQYHSGE